MVRFLLFLIILTIFIACVFPVLLTLATGVILIIAMILLFVTPIISICLLHMKYKGWTEHTYKFLGFTIKLSNKKGGKKNGEEVHSTRRKEDRERN